MSRMKSSYVCQRSGGRASSQRAASRSTNEPRCCGQPTWSVSSANRDDTSAYGRSKTIAERAAWAWHKAEGGALELVTVNPALVLAGSPVYAGSINQSGAIEIRAERIGRDTSYGKIIEAVENAERSRAPVQRLADRMAGYLVYFALASAALTFLISHDIRATISVVIVAGACGIAAGTPLAILGGIGRAARLGAIIKGGLYLETLGRVDTVVLDKTGTLTFGRPEVQRIAAVEGVSSHEVLDAAAAAESRSEHPLGLSIVSYAREAGRLRLTPIGSFAARFALLRAMQISRAL